MRTDTPYDINALYGIDVKVNGDYDYLQKTNRRNRAIA